LSRTKRRRRIVVVVGGVNDGPWGSATRIIIPVAKERVFKDLDQLL